MNRYEKILQERRAAARARLAPVAEAVREIATRNGIEIRFFGSYARGVPEWNSDLDILVMNDLDRDTRWRITAEITRAASRHGVAADIRLFRDGPHLAEESVP